MRVLLVNQVFHPDVAATAQHAHDLARHLTEAGHEVLVVASRSLYGRRGVSMPRRETVDGIAVHRVGRSFFGKAGLAGRAADFALFHAAAMIRALTLPRPDVVVCLTTPPFIALVGVAAKWLRRCRFVYWVMDLYPEVPIGCGVMRERGAAARVFATLHRFVLRRADRVVVLGRCMEQRVLAAGASPQRVERIGVWADPDEIRPGPSDYRDEWALRDRTVVMYSGNIGLAHDVETLGDAMAALADDGRLRFVVVGAGKGKPLIDELIRDHGLSNVVTAPPQPRERLGSLLSCGDIHLVSMRPGLEGAIVPSKLYGIMAAARPVIFVGPFESEIARVLHESDCGIVVPPGDVDGLVAAIQALADDPDRAAAMGERARATLQARYSRQRACESWRIMLEEVVGAAHRVPAPREAS